MQDKLRLYEAEKAKELKQELLHADGGCVSATALATSLNSTSSDIKDLEAQGRIFSVPDGEERRYPTWQFDQSGQPYDLISEVLRIWTPLNRYALLAFFVGGHEAFSEARPLDLLRDGRANRLLWLARYEAAQYPIE